MAKSKLQAGMVGLMKSGKSSVLNALMRNATLPVAIQAETAVEVRIIHSVIGTEMVSSLEKVMITHTK